MSTKHKDWTREEHVLVFNLYCKIPFGRQHQGAPEVIQLAELIGRTPSAVAIKLSNFTRLDPEEAARGIKGMTHGAKGEIDVWREFESNPEGLAFESERLLAKATGRKVEEIADIDERDLPQEGIERERMVRVRVNQCFFRTVVLAAYGHRCCVTGLAVPELLVASHIVPWAHDPKQRLNPRNGLCLNALHDRAFDRGLMFFDGDLKVRFHARLKSRVNHEGLEWLLRYEGRSLCAPKKFRPDPALLRWHAAKLCS